MGLSLYNLKKWTKMIFGKSLMHVNQGVGKAFVPNNIDGYFNDLTLKVLNDKATLEKRGIPIVTDEKAGNIIFPIAIFQYGLGCFDLMILDYKEIYESQFLECVNWAVDNQLENGAWDNFSFLNKLCPYSAMAQGEGASLLLRAYKKTKDIKYLNAAKKALDFMLVSTIEGGTSLYVDNDLFLLEYTDKAPVLNGWIFASIGLYDYYLTTNDSKYLDLFSKTTDTILKNIHRFDCGYWSKYDLGNTISSPFYHDLHIAQLTALFNITNNELFSKYAELFAKYKKNPFKKTKAFFVKAIQKVGER